MNIFKSRLLWFFIILIALGIGIYYSGLTAYFSLQNLQANMLAFKQQVDRHYVCSAILYTLILAIMAAISLPIIIFYVLLGGFLFGTIMGTILSVIGAVTGSIVSFLIFRYALKSLLQKKYREHLHGFNEKMKEHGISYILILHYLSVVPFFIINTLAALAPISLLQFIMITIGGCLPLFFVYSFAGRELATIQSTNDIFSPEVIIACSLLILLALLPIIIKKFKK